MNNSSEENVIAQSEILEYDEVLNRPLIGLIEINSSKF